MSTHHPLPAAWVERLFARFAATWGVQRLGATFPVETHVETKRIWAEQLGRFEGETIARAVQAETDSGREWPPSLAEFVESCRQASLGRVSSQGFPALPAPADPAVGQAALEPLRGAASATRDPLRWARHPRSVHAVVLLIRGAQRDRRLQEILRGHVADAGERLPDDGSAAVLLAVAAREPSLAEETL